MYFPFMCSGTLITLLASKTLFFAFRVQEISIPEKQFNSLCLDSYQRSKMLSGKREAKDAQSSIFILLFQFFFLQSEINPKARLKYLHFHIISYACKLAVLLF